MQWNSLGFDKCICLHSANCSQDTEHYRHPRKLLHAPCPSAPSPTPTETALFWLHKAGVLLRKASFRSTVFLKLKHVVSWICSLFLFIDEWYSLCEYATFGLFPYRFVKTWAARSFCLFWTFLHSSFCCPYVFFSFFVGTGYIVCEMAQV